MLTNIVRVLCDIARQGASRVAAGSRSDLAEVLRGNMRPAVSP